MNRTAIFNKTPVTGTPSADAGEWTRRRVAEIIYSATQWGYGADPRLCWFGGHSAKGSEIILRTFGEFEQYRHLYKAADPGPDWQPLASGLFAKGDPETGVIEFLEIHKVLGNGHHAFPKSGNGWITYHGEEISHLPIGVKPGARVTWQERRFAEKAMTVFISSGSALAE
jgi:hypothetical protein